MAIHKDRNDVLGMMSLDRKRSYAELIIIEEAQWLSMRSFPMKCDGGGVGGCYYVMPNA